MNNELFGPRSAALRFAEPSPQQLGSLRSRPTIPLCPPYRSLTLTHPLSSFIIVKIKHEFDYFGRCR